MYIYPKTETIVGMTTPPWFGTLIALLLTMCFLFVHRPYVSELNESRFERRSQLQAEIVYAEKTGAISDTIAQELIDNPQMIELEDFKQNIPKQILDAYERINMEKLPSYGSLSDFNLKEVIASFLDMSYFMFIFCMLFFLLCSYVLEHVFHGISFFSIFFVLLLALFGVSFEETTTWSLPLRNIFPVLIFGLWWLVLRVRPTSQVVFAYGVFPLKSFSGRLSIPSVAFPILFLAGVFIENKNFIPFEKPIDAIWITLTSMFFLSLVPMVFPSRLKKEGTSQERVIGKKLNSIMEDINAGDVEAAREKIKEVNYMKLSYPQNASLVELAWKIGQKDVVRAGYQRQLLLFRGTQEEKVELLKEMVKKGIKLTGTQFEMLVKGAIKGRDSSTLRNILPNLRIQKEATQRDLMPVLREEIKRAIAIEDRIYLQDIKPTLQGIPMYSPLVVKMDSILKEKMEEESYIDNYQRVTELSKLINVKINKIAVDYMDIELPNQTRQEVPWSAIRGLFGVYIHTNRTGILLLEFKKKLFGCQFSEDDFMGELEKSPFFAIWDSIEKQKPANIPMTDIDNFGTVSEQGLMDACSEFVAKYL